MIEHISITLAQRDKSSLFDDILLGTMAVGTGVILYKVFENFQQRWEYGYATPSQQGEQTLDIPPTLPSTPYPPVIGRTGPNRGICTGSCRPGTFDSQGFCIDSGCGSVIKSSSCKKNGKDKDKDKKKKKHGKITTTTTTNPEGTTTSTITEPSSTVTIPAGPTDPHDNTTPDQSTTPAQTPTPASMTTSAQIFKPFRPQSGTYHGQTINSDGCYTGHLSSGKRDTCRWVADVDQIVTDNDYAVDCDVTLGNRSADSEWPHDDPRVEITSGGPGSTGKNCCGFTMSINIKDGTLHMESEDWSGASGKVGHTTGSYYCDDRTGKPKFCTTQNASISDGQPLFQKRVHIHWEVRRDNAGNVYYIGEASGPGGTVSNRNNPIRNPTSPGLKGSVLIPGHYAPDSKKAKDPNRIRVDSAGLAVDFNGGPTVTILGKNTYKQGFARAPYYQGNLGYITSYEAALM
jgi:hypothetical protein